MDQKKSQLPQMKMYRWRWTFGLKKEIDVRENNYTGVLVFIIHNIQFSETVEKNGLAHKIWSKIARENWFGH